MYGQDRWGLEFIFAVVSSETASLLEQKRTGKAGKLEVSNKFAAALLFNPPRKFTDQDASPRRSHPENSLIGRLSELPLHAAHLPLAARRASALAPSHCPPARCPSSFPVLCQYLRIHAILVARLSPPLSSSKIPPTDAHLTARQESPISSSHFRNTVSRLLPFCPPSNRPPLSRESSPRRQASFGALRQFFPPRRNHETPARLRPPPYHGLPFVTSQRPCRRNGAAPGTFQLSAAAPRQQPKQHVESAERRRG